MHELIQDEIAYVRNLESISVVCVVLRSLVDKLAYHTPNHRCISSRCGRQSPQSYHRIGSNRSSQMCFMISVRLCTTTVYFWMYCNTSSRRMSTSTQSVWLSSTRSFTSETHTLCTFHIIPLQHTVLRTRWRVTHSSKYSTMCVSRPSSLQ
jgi:hypothetical protein